MARPTKLNAEVTRKVCEAVKLGSTYADAAGYAGIAYRTFADWMQSEEPEFVQFQQAVKDAQAAGKIGLLAKIEKAINEGAWQAAAWKLERRDPEYARRDRVQLTGKDDGPVKIETGPDLSKLTKDELRAMEAMLAKASGESTDP
jgi:hypothetical protein